MKDVAAAAGVSVGTVSNVLNRPERVSGLTRARVQQAMRELGFVRNESARQLRAGKSRVLAYVMLDASNPFFTDVAQGIEDVAEAADLSVFICNSDQREERERSYLTRLKEQRVQGVLITPVDPDGFTIDDLARRGTPVVIVDGSRGGGMSCSVAVDDVLGGRLAAEHLLDLGHERIAFVGGPERIGQVRDRREGAWRALTAAGRAREDLVMVGTDALTVAEGRGAGARLAGMARKVRPTAAFCANDLLALGLLQECVTLGIRVPDDLAIVGYDDIDFAAAATVPLTSVRQPRRQLGRMAAELLIDEAGNPFHRHQQVLFTPELVARATTRQG
ncbi:LacI family DNA-binding transcriptional regulator [Phytohabitans rumicis]|uniref:LacI family transcriptional regulator n=1 Tax=Phytohabitans rumicis TaxID=1076125 RepID=A0A6V8LID7_9ACTN|nr:LacI family DNA-binding transcriptional regulator [Phytohabitans rumicis]GFJ93867.1 LacI family transcriptional regulator [Phytohabitans rumicis]